MKAFTTICLWLGIFVIGYGQTITIKDREDLQPLEAVTLAGRDAMNRVYTAFTLTDAKGRADITAFTGLDSIELRLIGYESRWVSYEELRQASVIYLPPTNIALDQVVVTASRWRQPKRSVPAKITTITAREVALQQPQTAADLLGNSGEVYIQKSQLGGGSPMIRGFSTNRLLLVVDGVRMNSAIFRSGNLQNVISLDPFATESVEVLFGPGSVIYGSDAIGGVMSFYTLTPTLATGTETVVNGHASLRYATASNERTGHADITLGGRKLASVTSFSFNDFGDLRMGRHGPAEYLRPEYVERRGNEDVVVPNDDPLVQRPTGYQQFNVMQKLRYRPNDRWDFDYGFHYSTTSDYSRYDRLLRYRGDLPRSAEWKYGPQVWMLNKLSANHEASSGLYDQLAIHLAQQFFEESRIDRDFNDAERRTRTEKVQAYSLNLDFGKTLGGSQRLNYGLDGVLNDVTSTGLDEDIGTGISRPGPARYPQSVWASYAAYLTYRNDFSEKFTLQAGTRYNQVTLQGDFDTTFYPFPFTEARLSNGALTGSLGAVYRPRPDWIWSANLSTGFRAPNVDDVGKVFDSEPGAVVIPNPDLEAEYAYNADLSVTKIIGHTAKLDLTAFYTRLDNALVRRNFTLNGQDSIVYDGELSRVQAIQNAAFATVWGIQAGLELQLPAGFGLTSHFNYQYGEEELDDGSVAPLRHAAPWFGANHLTYSARGLKLDLYAVYNGEVSYEELAPEERGKDYIYAVDENGRPYSPAWYTINLKASYQLLDNLALHLGLENITDRRYRPYSSGIVAAGRNLIVAVRAGF